MVEGFNVVGKSYIVLLNPSAPNNISFTYENLKSIFL